MKQQPQRDMQYRVLIHGDSAHKYEDYYQTESTVDQSNRQKLRMKYWDIKKLIRCEKWEPPAFYTILVRVDEFDKVSVQEDMFLQTILHNPH